MLFYGVTMIVLYLVTATKRTAEARLPLFIVLTINFVLERSVTDTILNEPTEVLVTLSVFFVFRHPNSVGIIN